MFRQRLDVEADRLLPVKASRLPPIESISRQCAARSGAGALEEHVLDKMGDAEDSAGSQREPDLIQNAHGHRTHVLMRSVRTMRPFGSRVRRRFAQSSSSPVLDCRSMRVYAHGPVLLRCLRRLGEMLYAGPSHERRFEPLVRLKLAPRGSSRASSPIGRSWSAGGGAGGR